jgi:hypothetical protein
VPTYSFTDDNNGITVEIFMTMAEREQFLIDNPHLRQELSCPATIAGTAKKPDNGFRDVLREVKKRNSRGISRSTVNTF